ncbi:MAG TPA: IS30 family transposase [Pyrinomonadaceae bacterium]|jgi:IS30 family transposase|nr:IS30 family transposase [Pyrinomonadaceae bacterium]
MSYTQLTREQRYQIYALKKAGHTQTATAAILGVHKSSISRELRRNRGGRGYRPGRAHESAEARQRGAHRPRISEATWARVEALLRRDWSPEQVAGRPRLEGRPTVSHERIYRYVYADKRVGGTLHLHLRCQRQRRKRYGKNSRRGQIAGRVGIEARPRVVEAKRRIGDWEADTIVGRRGRGALLSPVERKSKLVRLWWVERKGAEEVAEASLTVLRPLAERVLTLTSDNGGEFAHHQRISEGLGADFYFARPHASWERGVNENTNGLVRQYFPKRADFAAITQAEVEQVVERLNERPRKTLGYRTPNEVFYKRRPVALQS